MQKKFDLRHLEKMATSFAERAKQSRAAFDIYQTEAKQLASPEAARKYTPEHIAELKAHSLSASRAAIRTELAEMRAIPAPLFAERRRWRKNILLRDARFKAAPAGALLSPEQQFQIELLDTVKRLQVSTWAHDLDEESLRESLDDALASEELGTLSVLVAEATRRKGVVAVHAEAVVGKLDLPEAEKAEAHFAAAETALRELEALEVALSQPASEFANQRPAYFEWERKRKEKAAPQPEIEQPSAA